MDHLELRSIFPGKNGYWLEWLQSLLHGSTWIRNMMGNEYWFHHDNKCNCQIHHLHVNLNIHNIRFLYLGLQRIDKSCNTISLPIQSFVHLIDAILNTLTKGERFLGHLLFEIYDRSPIAMLTFFIHLSRNGPLGASSKPYCRFPAPGLRQLAMISPSVRIESIPFATLSAVRTSDRS